MVVSAYPFIITGDMLDDFDTTDLHARDAKRKSESAAAQSDVWGDILKPAPAPPPGGYPVYTWRKVTVP